MITSYSGVAKNHETKLYLGDEYFQICLYERGDFTWIQRVRHGLVLLSFFFALPLIVLSRFNPVNIRYYLIFLIVLLIPDLISKFRSPEEPNLDPVWTSKRFPIGDDSRLVTTAVLIVNAEDSRNNNFEELKDHDQTRVESITRVRLLDNSRFTPDYQLVIPVALFSDNTIVSIIPMEYLFPRFDAIRDSPVPFTHMMGRISSAHSITRDIRDQYQLESAYHYEVPGGLIATTQKFRYK